MLSIIDSILDLSKIEAGKLNLERRRIDLREIVSRAADMLSERIKAKGLLLAEVPDSIVPLVGDPTIGCNSCC